MAVRRIVDKMAYGKIGRFCKENRPGDSVKQEVKPSFIVIGG